jgi:predicted NUDIX family NTP pyrophosphohydrolase
MIRAVALGSAISFSIDPVVTTAAKRSKQSAGILAYRLRQSRLEVFLVHPGGPYWASKDEGAWSIPKGEYAPDEEPLAAAQREFQEETGLPLSGRFIALPPVRQASGKQVLAWAVEATDLDPTRVRSNCFKLEWPPRSGVQQEFPEVDRAGWFALPEAERKLIAGQRALLQSLCDRLETP